MSPSAPIIVISKPVDRAVLAGLLGKPYENLIKFVVDLEQRVVALGGEMHADAEAVLIDRGSRQESLWGGNYFPGKGEEECVVYSSLINIRPSQQNLTMVVQDPKLRAAMKSIIFDLVGRGESLP